MNLYRCTDAACIQEVIIDKVFLTIIKFPLTKKPAIWTDRRLIVELNLKSFWVALCVRAESYVKNITLVTGACCWLKTKIIWPTITSLTWKVTGKIWYTCPTQARICIRILTLWEGATIKDFTNGRLSNGRWRLSRHGRRLCRFRWSGARKILIRRRTAYRRICRYWWLLARDRGGLKKRAEFEQVR